MNKERSKSQEALEQEIFEQRFQRFVEEQRNEQPSPALMERWRALPLLAETPSEHPKQEPSWLLWWMRLGFVAGAGCLLVLAVSGWRYWAQVSQDEPLAVKSLPVRAGRSPHQKPSRIQPSSLRRGQTDSLPQHGQTDNLPQREQRPKPSPLREAVPKRSDVSPEARPSSWVSSGNSPATRGTKEALLPTPPRLSGALSDASPIMAADRSLRPCQRKKPHKHPTLKYLEHHTPLSLHPLWANDAVSLRALDWTFDRLVALDPRGRVVLGLAQRIEPSKDGLSVVFQINPKVRWYLGRSVQAKDVAFTIQAWQVHRRRFDNFSLQGIVKKVEIVSVSQVRVHLYRRWLRPLRWFQFHVFPAPKVPRGDLSLHDWVETQRKRFVHSVSGSGPFFLQRWIGHKLIFKRKESDWRRRGYNCWSRVILQAVPDQEIQAEILKYGGTDLIPEVLGRRAKALARASKLSVVSLPRARWMGLALNQGPERVLRDKAVRQALLLALDRRHLARQIVGSLRVLDFPWLGSHAYLLAKQEPQARNLARAARLLTKAGWLQKQTGAIRRKNGRALVLRMVYPQHLDAAWICRIFYKMWKSVGIKVEFIGHSSRRWRRSVLQQKNFDVALSIWQTKDAKMLWELLHRRGRDNATGYQNAQVSALLDALVSARDWTQHVKKLTALRRLLRTELPFVFLFPVGQQAAFSLKLKQVSVHPDALFRWAYNWRKQ